MKIQPIILTIQPIQDEKIMSEQNDSGIMKEFSNQRFSFNLGNYQQTLNCLKKLHSKKGISDFD